MGFDIGPWKDAVLAYATDDDLTPAVDVGGEFEHLLVIIPALSASATVTVLCSRTVDGTYGTVCTLNPTQAGHFVQGSSSGAGGIEVVFDIHFCQFVKIATSAGQSANRTFQVRGFGLGG